LIQVVLPLIGQNGTLAGYLECIDRLDEQTLRAQREQVRNGALTAVVSVLVAALLLYPLLLAMLHRSVGLSRRLLESNLSLLRSLGNAVAKRDSDTDAHNYRVTFYAVALAEAMGFPKQDIADLVTGAFLHDVGKIGISERIISKPERLSREEFDIMKLHPRSGWEILKVSHGVSEISLDVCLHHHERIDGKGYPEKLSGESISLFARMGAICDVYDAITSERCYKPGWEPAEAIRKMAEWKDGNYDETVFHAFIKTVGIYPVGTLVRLESGRLGVVADQSPGSLLTPRVVVFYSSRSREHIYPEPIELSKSRDTIAGIEKAADWKFDPAMLQGMVQLAA